MGAKYTDAQKRASEEYQKKLKQIKIAVKPEIKERYENAAKKAGMPLRAYVMKAVEEKIERDIFDGID